MSKNFEDFLREVINDADGKIRQERHYIEAANEALVQWMNYHLPKDLMLSTSSQSIPAYEQRQFLERYEAYLKRHPRFRSTDELLKENSSLEEHVAELSKKIERLTSEVETANEARYKLAAKLKSIEELESKLEAQKLAHQKEKDELATHFATLLNPAVEAKNKMLEKMKQIEGVALATKTLLDAADKSDMAAKLSQSVTMTMALISFIRSE